jgi:hypothetical protein
MTFGSKAAETKLLGSASYGRRPNFGGRKFFEGQAKTEKPALHKGLEMLMNRSVMKGIVDPVERSVALGADVSRKMGALEAATGKSAMEMLKTLGSKK